MNWIFFLPAVACKIQVCNRLKIQFIKLDISNWRITRIKYRYIGGQATAGRNIKFKPEKKSICHFGNFSILAKWHFWTCAWNWTILKIANMSQGPPNPEFMSVKVENWNFLVKDSQNFKHSFQFGFLWNPGKSEKQNQKVSLFSIFTIVKKTQHPH